MERFEKLSGIGLARGRHFLDQKKVAKDLPGRPPGPRAGRQPSSGGCKGRGPSAEGPPLRGRSALTGGPVPPCAPLPSGGGNQFAQRSGANCEAAGPARPAKQVGRKYVWRHLPLRGSRGQHFTVFQSQPPGRQPFGLKVESPRAFGPTPLPEGGPWGNRLHPIQGPKRQPGTVHETSGGPGCRAPREV